MTEPKQEKAVQPPLSVGLMAGRIEIFHMQLENAIRHFQVVPSGIFEYQNRDAGAKSGYERK